MKIQYGCIKVLKKGVCKVSDYFTKNNIYDKNGILLISKGQKITDAIITKLKSLKIYKPEELVNFDNKQSIVSTQITNAFRAKINIRDDYVLEKANKVLSTIIFESKTKPWWIYVNALSNYVD